MRILFVNPPYVNLYEKSGLRMGMPVYPPLNLSLLSSIARKEGYEVEILDLNLFRKNFGKYLLNRISTIEPNLVAFTVTTPTYIFFKNCTKIIREEFGKNVVIVVGGPHASSLPEEVLLHTDVDFVFVGEGEISFRNFLREYPRIKNIDGIAIRKGRRVVCGRRLFVKNLDELPLPSWDLLKYIKRYRRNYTKKNPVTIIQTTRGCPFRCIYCNKSIFGYKFRAMSPVRTVREFEWVIENGFKEIHLADDIFTHDMKRAKMVCELLIKRKFNYPWALMSGVRVNEIDREFLVKAYKAGCYSISFGVESGKQRILNIIRKGVTLNQIRRAFKLAKDIGMEVMGSFMIGLPGETIDDIESTIEFAIELDPDWVKFTIATPMPGTYFFELMEKKGLIKSRNWERYYFHLIDAPRPFRHDTISDKVLDLMYKKAYRKFILRREFVFRRIKKLQWLTDLYGFFTTLILH